MDLVIACGARAESRRDILIWQTRQSDVDSCVELHRRRPVTSLEVDLMSPKALVLSLLDNLEAKGLRGVNELVIHHKQCLVFDQRSLPERRA